MKKRTITLSSRIKKANIIVRSLTQLFKNFGKLFNTLFYIFSLIYIAKGTFNPHIVSPKDEKVKQIELTEKFSDFGTPTFVNSNNIPTNAIVYYPVTETPDNVYWASGYITYQVDSIKDIFILVIGMILIFTTIYKIIDLFKRK
jgi:hypothetical protein